MSFAEDLKLAINLAFRDYTTDGVPASGDHDPVKAEIRAALQTLADVALTAGTTKVVATVAQLATLPDPQVGDRAEVRDDPLGDVEDGNGVWGYDGADWVWVSDLFPQAALDAIAAVEAAGIAALAALPASRVIPTTVALSNPNLFSMTPVAPHVGDATSLYLGLAGGSNTSTLVEVTLPNGIGKKAMVLPDGGPIPLRHLVTNYPILVQYVAALDKAVLLEPGVPAASIITTEVAAGDTAAHIKRKIAPVGGRLHAHPDVQEHQTIDVVVSNDKIFGNCQFTLYDRDGTTQLFTGVIRDTDKVTVVSPAGVWKAKSLLRLRIAGGAPYMLLPTDAATPALSKLFAAVISTGQIPNDGNTIQTYRVDDVTWYMDVYPHDNHYLGGQKRNRGSDVARFVVVNMGPFMSVSMGAPALNGYFQRQKRQQHDWCNFQYDDPPVGIFPETGSSPSTAEPIFYAKRFGTGTPGSALANGNGHGGLTPDLFKMTGTKSDPSTGNLPPFNSGVTAATRTNPLTVTIPGANYQVGRTFTLQGITGMTQLNGVPLTVSAVAPGDVYTINGIDSTGWGVFTGHTAGNYVEKDTLNLQDLPIGKVYSGDRVQVVASGYTGAGPAGGPATPGDKSSRYTYTLTFDSHPDYQCRLQARYDPTDPGVNITTATVNGNMAYLCPVRDADQVTGYLNGTPVVASHTGTTLMPIGQGDDVQRGIGMVDELRFAFSGAPTAQIRFRNRSGAPDGGSATGYSHKENGVKIARAGSSFVTTFKWGNKGYGDPIRVVAGDQDVHTVVFDFDVDITMLSAPALV